MRWKCVEECLGGVWEAGRGLRGFFWCGHGRLWSMGFGDGWRGGGVGGAGGGVSVSWGSWLVGVVFGLQSCYIYSSLVPRYELVPSTYL